MNLSELARKFHRFEVLSFERQQQPEKPADSAGEVIRVGITTLSSSEQERVVTVPPTAEAQIDNIEGGFEDRFSSPLWCGWRYQSSPRYLSPTVAEVNGAA